MSAVNTVVSLTREERLDRLDKMIAEGRIMRRAWTDTVPGLELACLLAAISPEAGEAKSSAACPAWLLPRWLACLVPEIDDNGTDAAWPAMVRRFGALMHRAHVLTADDWQALDWQCRAVAVREARSHVPAGDSALVAIDRVLALLDRGGGTSEERRAAAARAAEVAVWASWAARAAAAEWSARAARAADAAAAAAAAAADAAAAAAAAAAVAARVARAAAAWDRMTAAWFDAIEAACAKREAARMAGEVRP